ncbi:MAG: hypothetical protein ACK5LL_05280 [Suipraeoptans sp.]
MSISFEGPEKVIINHNKVGIQLLINNILSNVSYYSIDGSDIDINITENNDSVTLVSANLGDKENIDRIMKNKLMGYQTGDTNINKENKFSSGNGMYIIRDLKEILDCDYKQSIKGNRVISTLVVHKQED